MCQKLRENYYRMDRGKKALINSIANACQQIVTVICGLILPRLILQAFGSSYNGITASITQFLSVIALFRAGVGGATRASLYKSLANKDSKQISATIRATEIFMRKIAFIFLAFVFFLAIVYPIIVHSDFSWIFTATLVLIISISTFIQYFFGISYQILFQADQRQYVTLSLEMIGTILNTFISVMLIKAGVGIHGVKLGSTMAFSITPITLNVLAKRQYRIDRSVKPDFSSISQRWDAFFHQLASFIHNNTDIVLLTLFTDIKIVSVYTVYSMVAGGLRNIIKTLITGVESAFGNILANNEHDVLIEDLGNVETMLHAVSGFLFGAAIVLITPFVQVYTKDVSDMVYMRHTFGYILIVSEMLFVLRSPYEALVNAAGHFKETKKYAFMEAGINFIISIILIQFYDLIGVAIGTLVAILFRTIVYTTYASLVIIKRSINVVLKRYFITTCSVLFTYCLCRNIPHLVMDSYFNWIKYAIEISSISIILTIVLNMMFYKNETIKMLRKISRIIKRTIKRV